MRVVLIIAKDVGVDLVVWRRIDVLEEIGYAVMSGVLTILSMARDSALAFTAMPSERIMRTEVAGG